MKPFFVYMLRCADGSFYVGHTDELERRVGMHQAGKIAGYTQERRPVELVWSQETSSREEALAAERRIKGWVRAKKEALTRGDWQTVSNLARSRASTGSAPTVSVDASAAKPPVLRQAQDERSGEVQDEPSGEAQDERFAKEADLLLHHNRRALAKAITLLESTRADDRLRADALLDALLPHTGRSLRIGLSGVPGVGKSTFIEALGLLLVQQGHRVAVLAVDPSSRVSGGSILGDKTRMERLAAEERAFIRPSPSSGTLGGVAEKTRETILACEAAGYDVVIVETVGVGQSETAVAGMTDLFVLLQLPNAGDDLQALKKGVMELADLVVVNKADLDEAAATRARAQMTSTLRMVHLRGVHETTAPVTPPPVLQTSALKNAGLDLFWQTVEQLAATRRADGRFAARRQQQNRAWMWERIEAGLAQRFRDHPAVKAALPQVSEAVDGGTLAPSVAARRLLDLHR